MSKTTKMIKAVNEISYHRNGVGGVGFWAIRFIDSEYDEHMLATVFTDDAAEDAEYYSVISLDRLGEHGVHTNWNAWRGDYFISELLEAIRTGRDAYFDGLRRG